MDTLELTSTRTAMTRRSFARLGAATAVAAVAGTLTVASSFAREAESGDDRGGHGRGNDDTQADNRGGHGNDDTTADDKGGKRKNKKKNKR